MSPDDPRHGQERGHEQHIRDGEEPCDPCRDAKLLAARRRTKRKTMGYKYQAPLGHLYWKLQALYKLGATYDDLTEWSGVVDSQVWRALNGRPDTIVYARTWHRFNEMQPGRIITPIGVTRRIQALMWLGWSTERIANEANCHVDSVRDSRDRPREFVSRKFKNGVADAYDRLSMRHPTGATRQERAGISRARNHARRKGWVAPLCWDDIDLDTEPTGHGYTAPDRATALRDLAEQGVGISEVCRRLEVGREALQKWCGNHGLSDVYRQLVAREVFAPNGVMEEGAA